MQHLVDIELCPETVAGTRQILLLIKFYFFVCHIVSVEQPWNLPICAPDEHVARSMACGLSGRNNGKPRRYSTTVQDLSDQLKTTRIDHSENAGKIKRLANNAYHMLENLTQPAYGQHGRGNWERESSDEGGAAARDVVPR